MSVHDRRKRAAKERLQESSEDDPSDEDWISKDVEDEEETSSSSSPRKNKKKTSKMSGSSPGGAPPPTTQIVIINDEDGEEDEEEINNSNPLVHQLKAMFPNYDNDVIHAVLEQAGNVEGAIESLLAFAEEPGTTNAPKGGTPAQRRGRRPAAKRSVAIASSALSSPPEPSQMPTLGSQRRSNRISAKKSTANPSKLISEEDKDKDKEVEKGGGSPGDEEKDEEDELPLTRFKKRSRLMEEASDQREVREAREEQLPLVQAISPQLCARSQQPQAGITNETEVKVTESEDIEENADAIQEEENKENPQPDPLEFDLDLNVVDDPEPTSAPPPSSLSPQPTTAAPEQPTQPSSAPLPSLPTDMPKTDEVEHGLEEYLYMFMGKDDELERLLNEPVSPDSSFQHASTPSLLPEPLIIPQTPRQQHASNHHANPVSLTMISSPPSGISTPQPQLSQLPVLLHSQPYPPLFPPSAPFLPPPDSIDSHPPPPPPSMIPAFPTATHGQHPAAYPYPPSAPFVMPVPWSFVPLYPVPNSPPPHLTYRALITTPPQQSPQTSSPYKPISSSKVKVYVIVMEQVNEAMIPPVKTRFLIAQDDTVAKLKRMVAEHWHRTKQIQEPTNVDAWVITNDQGTELDPDAMVSVLISGLTDDELKKRPFLAKPPHHHACTDL